ncbi:MAG: thioredoxin domain-containing protein [bacterium]
MIKKADQQKEKSNGAPLIAVAIFLAGFTIAVAVLVKDKVALPFGKDRDQEQVLGTGAEIVNDGELGLISVADNNSPFLGSTTAPVVIYEISDFACPYCALAAGFREDLRQDIIKNAQDNNRQDLVDYWETWLAPVTQIKEKYINTGKVRLVFKAIPGHGQLALKASEAALCAGDQGKFWEYHDVLFAKQADWYSEEATDESLAVNLKAYAADLGLNESEFEKCLNGEIYSKDMMQNYSDSQEVFNQLKTAGLVGANQNGLGTPTYIINGRYLSGAQSFSEFEKIIEEELSK